MNAPMALHEPAADRTGTRYWSVRATILMRRLRLGIEIRLSLARTSPQHGVGHVRDVRDAPCLPAHRPVS